MTSFQTLGLTIDALVFQLLNAERLATAASNGSTTTRRSINSQSGRLTHPAAIGVRATLAVLARRNVYESVTFLASTASPRVARR